MKPRRNYATIVLVIIAVAIIGIAIYFGSSQLTKITFDDSKTFQKNITVISKVAIKGVYIVTDAQGVAYTTSERASVIVRPDKNYAVTYRQTNNGTGYWIDKFVQINKLT